MKFLSRRALGMAGVFLFVAVVATAMIHLAIQQWHHSDAEEMDIKRHLANELGIDSVSGLELNLRLVGMRSLGTILHRGTEELIAAGGVDPRTMHRGSVLSLTLDLADFRGGEGEVVLPLLGSRVVDRDSVELHLRLDSAQVIELTRGDLVAYLAGHQTASLGAPDSALVIRRIIEARLALTVTRRAGASRAGWVRDSAEIAERWKGLGVRLILESSSSNQLQYRTPDPVVIAYQTVPVCTVAPQCRTDFKPATPASPSRTSPLGDGGPRPASSNRERVEPPILVPVHIWTKPRSARIWIDDVEQGMSNRTVMLPPGRHLIQASTLGYAMTSEVVQVEREMAVTLELVRQ